MSSTSSTWLTTGEEGLWGTTTSGSLLRSILSCSWCSRAKPAAMSLGTRSVSCSMTEDLTVGFASVEIIFDAAYFNVKYILFFSLYSASFQNSLTEKKLLKSWEMLENAARELSSCGRQQHRSRSLLSHTLTASERAVDRNWVPSLLCMSRTPSGSMAGGWGRGFPSGSKTNTTPTAVNSRMIQLLPQQKQVGGKKVDQSNIN